MRYDPERLQPLYRLEIGKPGSSFAIEIARKIGLPKQIVERATQLVGKDKIRYDRLLEGLEKEKADLELRTAEAAKAERRMKKAAQEYQDLKKYLDETTLEVLRDAKAKAKLLLKDTNQQIEATIQEIRLGQGRQGEDQGTPATSSTPSCARSSRLSRPRPGPPGSWPSPAPSRPATRWP